jgi:hypothetical protein
MMRASFFAPPAKNDAHKEEKYHLPKAEMPTA